MVLDLLVLEQNSQSYEVTTVAKEHIPLAAAEQPWVEQERGSGLSLQGAFFFSTADSSFLALLVLRRKVTRRCRARVADCQVGIR